MGRISLPGSQVKRTRACPVVRSPSPLFTAHPPNGTRSRKARGAGNSRPARCTAAPCGSAARSAFSGGRLSAAHGDRYAPPARRAAPTRGTPHDDTVDGTVGWLWLAGARHQLGIPPSETGARGSGVRDGGRDAAVTGHAAVQRERDGNGHADEPVRVRCAHAGLDAGRPAHRAGLRGLPAAHRRGRARAAGARARCV